MRIAASIVAWLSLLGTAHALDNASVPTKIPTPWGNSAGMPYIRTVPIASQIGIQNGAASFTDGFPPLTFLPAGAGGVPPFGADFNGALNQITQWSRWQGAGAQVPYDGTFQSAIGGYPQWATVGSFRNRGIGLVWTSTVDNNTNNPDTGGLNWVVGQRVRLPSDLVLYVATGGSDAQNFCFNSMVPCATVTRAMTVLAEDYDLNGFAATIQLADGTYTESITGRPMVGQVDETSLNIVGNIVTPANVVMQANGNVFQTSPGAAYTIKGMKIGGMSVTACIIPEKNGLISIGASIVLGNAINAQILADGGQVSISQPFAINATAAPTALSVDNGGQIIDRQVAPAVFTVTGTPAYASSFARAAHLGIISFAASSTFSGAATGARYLASMNGIIETSGGANYFPGNSAGSTSTGGQYE